MKKKTNKNEELLENIKSNLSELIDGISEPALQLWVVNIFLDVKKLEVNLEFREQKKTTKSKE